MVDDDEYFPDVDAVWEERMEAGYWDINYDPTEYDPNDVIPDDDDFDIGW